jgi:CRP-like cAMP-binding protein
VLKKHRKGDDAVYREIIIKVLTNVPVFRELSNESIGKLAQLAKLCQHAPGATVFREGDPGDCLFIIASGKIDILSVRPGGEELKLNTLGPGEVFGEMALLDGLPRSAAARVGEAKALLFYINRTDFNLFLLKNPEVSLKLVETMSRRLRNTNMKIKELTDVNENLKALLHSSPAP